MRELEGIDITVTQAGDAAYLTVDPQNRDVGSAAGTTKFAVKSNIIWQVTETEDWLGLANMKCPPGDGEFIVLYEENTSTEQRIGKLTVSGGGLSVHVTVTQAGAKARTLGLIFSN